MPNKIIQLVPWRDLLLGLTEQGEVYSLVDLSGAAREFHAVLLFPGLPIDREEVPDA